MNSLESFFSIFGNMSNISHLVHTKHNKMTAHILRIPSSVVSLLLKERLNEHQKTGFICRASVPSPINRQRIT